MFNHYDIMITYNKAKCCEAALFHFYMGFMEKDKNIIVSNYLIKPQLRQQEITIYG